MSRVYLTGVNDQHITTKNSTSLQESAFPFLNQLKQNATIEGIDLQVVSSYRSFNQQKFIWNEKATGKRDLLNLEGQKIQFSQLSTREILNSILRWSAIPGMSRHHWGTDIDIIDSNPLLVKPNYKIQLSPHEYQRDGIFSILGAFLENCKLESYGFFRPYNIDRGGVAPEPWHLSCSHLALEQEQILTLEVFEQWLHSPEMQELALIDLLKEHAQDIFKTYVVNTQANPMA